MSPEKMPGHPPSVHLDAPDWSALERLRRVFLNGVGAEGDYWQSEAVLAAYDATFAQRIGWKWDHVLGDLALRDWQPPPGPVLDWGCGSGVAARAWVDAWGQERVREVWFWDRSPAARRFAVARARVKYPGLAVAEGLPENLGTLLVSHVLTELDAAATETLLELAGRAAAVVWVEPGTYEASWRLIRARERLRGQFHVVAPCPHGASCGLLSPPGLETHWCHHFAAPPPAVFTDPFWGRFARAMGVDLRSLPVSYLVLDRRLPPPLPAGTVRVIGRPRVYKAHAVALACDTAGVAEMELRQRDLPTVFRAWRKGACPGWQVWEQTGGRVRRVMAWPAASPSDQDTGGENG